MQVTIMSVQVNTVPTAKGSYQVAEIAFKDKEGKISGKKLMSFNHKEVFDTLKLAKSGETYQVKTEKNDKGYWDWVSVSQGETVEAASSVGNKATASPKSTYETPEERAKKQVYIVRQSSISAAVSLLAANGGKKNTPQDVINTAKQFEAFVFDTEYKDEVADTNMFSNMENDIV